MSSKKYWLWWGMSLALLNILFSLWMLNLPGVKNPTGFSDLIVMFFPNALPFILYEMITSTLLHSVRLNHFGLYYVYGSISWFLIGSVLGLLYGKAKEKGIKLLKVVIWYF